MLYENIESLDTLIAKLSYTLQAHRAYTGDLLDDYYSKENGMAIKALNGIDATNEDLIKEFEIISERLTETMKTQREIDLFHSIRNSDV